MSINNFTKKGVEVFRKSVLSVLCCSVIVGCGSRTGVGVKEYYLLNEFDSNINYMQSSNIIHDMSQYCSSGLYKYKRHDFKNIRKNIISSELDYMGKSYYMSIEIESTDNNTSHIKIYDYYNNSNTRNMAKTIEKWVNKNSTECVQGF